MQIIEAIKKYLSILDSDKSEEEAIKNLIASLDELAFLSHNISYETDEKDYPDPPERDHSKTLDKVRKRFSSLGVYNVTGEISHINSECDVHSGDAISDIAEIADDLNEVLWYFNNTSNDNTLFYFKLDFATYWGRYLRTLHFFFARQMLVVAVNRLFHLGTLRNDAWIRAINEQQLIFVDSCCNPI